MAGRYLRTRALLVSLCLAAATATAAAAGPHDGLYRGTTKLVMMGHARGGGLAHCAGSAEGVASARRIQDSQIRIIYDTSEVIAQVAPDGAISGSGYHGAEALRATGKVGRNVLTLEFGTRFCTYRFEGSRGR